MSRIVKFVKTIRNNWKKTVFFSCVAVYGADFGYKKYGEHLLRRAYCLEAKRYGDVSLVPGQKARRITVFLNPAAQKGKSRKLFETNVAPILHLAGLEVTVIKTEYEGQVKKYMDVLEDTDGVVVAGGDGTLLEVVTGLLRRSDQEKAARIPVGVVPLGHTNTLAQALYNRGESQVRWLLEASMSVVKNKTMLKDVLHIQSEAGDVYAVNSLNWGAYCDAEERKKKYWYFATLKHRLTYVMSVLGQWPPRFSADVLYVHPCEGCSRCYTAPTPPPWRWWHFFLPPRIELPKKDYSAVSNEQCGEEHSEQISTIEFSCNSRNACSGPHDKGMDVYIEPDDVTRTDFIKEGWRRLQADQDKCVPSELRKHLAVQKFSIDPGKPEEGAKQAWFSIDNERYESMAVHVSLLPDRIHVFHGDDTFVVS